MEAPRIKWSVAWASPLGLDGGQGMGGGSMDPTSEGFKLAGQCLEMEGLDQREGRDSKMSS